MAKRITMTEERKEILRGFGETDADIPQIAEAMEAAKFRYISYDGNTDKRIGQAKAFELLGEKVFLSGIDRAAFHRTAARETPDEKGLVFIEVKW